MKLNLHLICACLLVYLTCIHTVISYRAESKPDNARSLCGDTFIRAWRMLCKWRSSGRTGKKEIMADPIIKDGAVLMYKRRSPNVLPKTVARSFLVSKNIHRSKIDHDNAHEECCLERCTWGEIAEYCGMPFH